tara:strand:- start:468 stop:947 length:480 start_codon:yes stop_codon:yes gene_type:complete
MNNKFIDSGAKFSNCRKYRYTLWRTWDDSKPKVMFLGLNPSTADEVNNDPTVTRCINYAKVWGYGGMFMMNIFAFRTTYPVELKKAKNPIGKDNDKWIKEISLSVDKSIGAWGNDGKFLDRSKSIKNIVKNLHCLKVNSSGEPAHPLYLKADLKPIKYN